MNRPDGQDRDFRHPPPRKQVLLPTCMDLRLLDDSATFMNRYNLEPKKPSKAPRKK